ncbi:MAG: hypothetical protein DA328_06680 [Nitrososphaeraceae archaeon]|nr:hypothetical protein [Nitrososphaeraceae archaeon]
MEGIWYNELGSKMIIDSINDGQIIGNYETTVGSAQGLYTLSGRTEKNVKSQENQSIGWVVVWDNEITNNNCVTSWSGQLQEIEGEEVIHAYWMLTIETVPGSNWKSTLIGYDTFKRTIPTASVINKHVNSRSVSHPL